jgi:hypothetical protein
MKTDSTKNSAPIAPTSAKPSNATGSKPRVAMPEKGKLIKKKNVAAGGPTGTTGMAKHVKQTGGARYGIRVKFQQTIAPEAGAIQANGRILPASIVRQSQSFRSSISDQM